MTPFVIATPMYESAKPWYCDSLARTCAAFPDAPYLMRSHTYIGYARELLVEDALACLCKGILWCDADMAWSPDDVSHVIGKNYVVVGKYPSRKENKIITEGAGFLWTPMHCFDVPRPWFFATLELTTGYRWVGEDVSFLRLMRSHGIAVESYESETLGHAYEQEGPRYLRDLR